MGELGWIDVFVSLVVTPPIGGLFLMLLVGRFGAGWSIGWGTATLFDFLASLGSLVPSVVFGPESVTGGAASFAVYVAVLVVLLRRRCDLGGKQLAVILGLHLLATVVLTVVLAAVLVVGVAVVMPDAVLDF